MDRIKVMWLGLEIRPNDRTIITGSKEAVNLQQLMFYPVLDIMTDLSHDKLYKETSKRTVSEKSVSMALIARYCQSCIAEVATCLQIMNRKAVGLPF